MVDIVNTIQRNQSLIAKLSAILAALCCVWYAVLWIGFSQDTLRQATLNALGGVAHSSAKAIEQQDFSLFPMPTLTMHSLQVKGNPQAKHQSILTAPTVVVRPSLASLFSSQPVVDVVLHEPRLKLEAMEGGGYSWDLESPEQVDAQGKVEAPSALVQSIKFLGSELHFIDYRNAREFRINELEFDIRFSSKQDYVIDGWFWLARDYFYFTYQQQSGGKLALQLENEYTSYNLQGTLSPEGDFDGKQELKSQDIGQLLEVFFVSGDKTPRLPEEVSRSPLQVTSQVKYDPTETLRFEEMEIEGQAAQGKATFSQSRTEQGQINIETSFELTHLLPDQLLQRGVFAELLKGKSKQASTLAMPVTTQRLIASDILADIQLQAEEAALLSVGVSDLKAHMKVEEQENTVRFVSGELAGEGQFLAKGNLEQSYDGVAFKGTVDVAGKDFRALFQPLLQREEEQRLGEEIKQVMHQAIALPESYKRYRGRSNVFWNPAILRMSEMVLRLEDMQLLGTIVRQKKQKLAVLSTGGAQSKADGGAGYLYEGAFRAKGVDADELWHAQLQDKEAVKAGYSKRVFYKNAFFDWVKSMQEAVGDSTLEMKLSFVDLMLNGEVQKESSFDFVLKHNFLSFKEMNIPFAQSQIGGNIGVSFKKDMPYLSGNMSFDYMDLDELFETEEESESGFWKNENGNWSRKEFDILWLDDVYSDLTLNIAQLKSGEYNLRNAAAEVIIENGMIQMRDIKFVLFGGVFEGWTKLLVGKLPTFTTEFHFRNFVFSRLHGATDLFDNLYGGGSLRGEITTTGVNPYSAIKNMQGTVSFAGSGLRVNGFNLTNMIRAANAVRTIEDIDRLVQFANRGGETKISTVQGGINISNGFLSTPGMGIATAMGGGNIKGKINMIDGSSEIAIALYLTSLQKKNPPNIRLLFSGHLDALEQSLDTQSLESFIARNTAERLLVNP